MIRNKDGTGVYAGQNSHPKSTIGEDLTRGHMLSERYQARLQKNTLSICDGEATILTRTPDANKMNCILSFFSIFQLMFCTLQ
jgi:hypothetical protein